MAWKDNIRHEEDRKWSAALKKEGPGRASDARLREEEGPRADVREERRGYSMKFGKGPSEDDRPRPKTPTSARIAAASAALRAAERGSEGDEDRDGAETARSVAAPAARRAVTAARERARSHDLRRREEGSSAVPERNSGSAADGCDGACREGAPQDAARKELASARKARPAPVSGAADEGPRAGSGSRRAGAPDWESDAPRRGPRAARRAKGGRAAASRRAKGAAGVLKNKVAQDQARQSVLARAGEAVKKAAAPVAKGLAGVGLSAVASIALIAVLLLSVGSLLMGQEEQKPPEGSSLPEAVEVWRPTVEEACRDIIGDEKWADAILALMNIESGGQLDVLCFPGAVKRQDIMQACEGAYGSWIISGGGPYRLEACTPKASIYAGTAEFKQNLDLWKGYLGDIGPEDADELALVIQGYNFGAQGWKAWNERHGYKTYTVERAQTYSDTVMPAGAKGTPTHAKKWLDCYTYGGQAPAGASEIVKRAYAELGKPYVYGAVGPDSYDCSGLVGYCLTGKHERKWVASSFTAFARVTDPQPGDICCNSHHCGIYIGNGQMIHAPHTGDVVKIGPVHSDMIYTRR